jgi:chromosome segregation protein
VFLKSLSLKGFKSFADATTMELEPGVTVVVGPNGSGKSNVVDAIAWVLGAQAPSAVRSQKMDDVIFAGTATRPALGRAEVSLTIDNSAGILPIEFSEVTVRRTLFRNGDSEYAINNVPCRLLDVQELLSDAGVGRQQHVIVSQGQIDAVLNARPEERRAIIEEAAGVLKYRRRKEKAERRLDATEGSLLRVQDLLREVRRQLRPLERQAEAAKRHGELVAELGSLRMYVAGREIAALRTRLTTLASSKHQSAADETRLKSELAQLDADVVALGAELSARGADDVSDRLARADQLRERARGLGALIAERTRGLERDRGQLLDEGLVATLEAEAARYRQELDEVAIAMERSTPEAEELAAEEAAFAVEREERLSSLDPMPTASASSAMAEVRGELRSRLAASERVESELRRGRTRLDQLRTRAAELDQLRDQHRHDCTAAELLESPLIEEMERAEQRTVDARAALDAAVDHRQRAAEAATTCTARVEALQMALDLAHARAGADHLADLEGVRDGVLGTLLDLVRIEDGWEPAVEAALGEALAAVVVSDPGTASAALAALRRSDTNGAVLALGLDPGPAAWRIAAGAPVRPHVSADRADVGRLLDVLLAPATRVDNIDEAIEAAVANPTAVIVTASGDRFGASGWRIGAAAAGGVTKAAIETAAQEQAAADAAVSVAIADVERLTQSLSAAERHEGEVASRLDANDQRFNASAEGLARAQAERREIQVELEPLQGRLDELAAQLEVERVRTDELQALVPDLEAGESAEAEAARTRHEVRTAIDARSAVLAGRRRDLEVRSAGYRERAEFLEQRLTETEHRLEADAEARVKAAERRIVIDATLVALRRLAGLVEARRAVVEAHHATLAERRRQQSEQVRALSSRLDAQRSRRADAERELDQVRERARRAEVDEAEARLRLESAVEMLRHDLDVEPEVAEAAEPPPLPEGVNAQARVRELDRELRLLGPINPLALEEFTELQQRHTFLEEQLEDVRTTRRELSRVIKAVDQEIQSVFAAAYADVSGHFATLFGGLFPGGTGRLILTSPDDLLNTGIEVEAKPGGKNVKKLSLLSGGERSLTALAFLFAVFRSRPSPFYVMDEVEAALDDVNLHRFLGLLAEFREEAQLLVVSHQKRTMEAGDCLFGVTMQPGGSSKVIAERVGVPS